MAENDAGERLTADRNNLFEDAGKVYRRVRDQDALDLLTDIATNTGGTTANLDDIQLSGTVGTTAIDLPAVAAGEIKVMIISVPQQTPVSKKLQFSIDGGTNYFTLSVGGMVGWEPSDISQIKVRGSVAGVNYDILLKVVGP